jgi:hypothetical protein
MNEPDLERELAERTHAFDVALSRLEDDIQRLVDDRERIAEDRETLRDRHRE